MKKLLPLLLLPTLAACNLNGVSHNDVTGTISNAPSGQGTIRMAVLGVSFGGITNDYVDQATVVPSDKGVFTISLPSNPRVGAYEVIAYADKNNNKKYDIGEARTKPNGKTIIYSEGGTFANLVGLSKGWNLQEAGKQTINSLPFAKYDLTF